MDNREIRHYVRKTNRLLKLVHMGRALQHALFVGLLSSVLLLLVSRLFVLPYYEFYAYAAGVLTLGSWLLLSFRNLPRISDAVHELDRFTPHNELLTIWQLPGENNLVQELTKKTAAFLPESYVLFKREPRHWLLGKWLAGSVLAFLALLWLVMFPGLTQQQAQEIEQERELVDEIGETAKDIEEQAETEQVKKEMQELQESVAEAETAEQALEELVKKQKEMKLQQQKLAAEGEGETAEADDLTAASEKLAGQAGKTQTALSNSGNPVSFSLQQTIANSQGSDADGTTAGGEGDSNPSDPAEETGLEAGETDSEEQDSETGSSDTGEGAGEGAGQGAGAGQGQSQGAGAGSGAGQGVGDGAGTGQGNRELLTAPSRLGGEGAVEVDRGNLGSGQASGEQEGAVPAERGTARPYADLVGDYSESYFTSADRIGLPADLQQVVEQYFTSVESNE